MFRNRLYYRIKPLLPWPIRMGIRRWFALRKRSRVADHWPILPGSEQQPAGWPGWPDGKQFAFVLTHDVEGPEGLSKVRPLAELEMSLGFRSCFNFIPEGTYRVPDELRAWLTANGFEVGVHDLKHDGRLFESQAAFRERAPRINHYLKDWGAAGFRSGFMLNERDWLHDLQIQYDASTFDTDPFEPKPDGVGTIFPFWIPRPTSARDPWSVVSSPLAPSSVLRPVSSDSLPTSDFGLRTSDFNSTGYVELPYTLPQDSTLFLLLRESTPAIWLRKLDWIAQHGGMALVNVHPDYVQFESDPATPRTAPVHLYEALLRNFRDRYAGQCLLALPTDLARYCRELMAPDRVSPTHER